MTADDVKLLPPPKQPTQYIPHPDSFTEFRYPDKKSLMTADDIEPAARRVYAIMPAMGELRIHRVGEPDPRFTYKTLRGPISWEAADEDYREHCRRIAAAALNVEESAR